MGQNRAFTRVCKWLTAAVDHDACVVARPGFLQGVTGFLDTLFSEVRALGSSAKDDVYIVVAASFNDGSQTLLGDTHESVRV